MHYKKKLKKYIPHSMIMYAKKILDKLNTKAMLNKAKKVQKYTPSIYPTGVNLIGDIKAETGLGQSMRILAEMLKRSNIDFCIIQIDSPGNLSHSENTWNDKIENELKYSINLIHINPSIWAEAYRKLDYSVLNNRYNIAYWLWELEEFPDIWVPCIKTVDEIWSPSRFICKGIQMKTNKPVKVVPYAIDIKTDSLYDRTYFELPDKKFLFLIMYDLKSISARKNPKGAVEAYKKAFPRENNNVGLVLKVNHTEGTQELKQLKQDLKEYKNIYYLTKNMTRKEVESLIAHVDVLVSLHRSEGFGLTLAEAMYLGTPVVATNWSATTEFMDNSSACLVDCSLIRLRKNIGPYKKGSYWAEANTNHAAQFIKRLFSDKEYYDLIQKNGKQKITDLNIEKMAGIIEKEIGSACKINTTQ